jgi:release factor glutamine methyltransferase
MASVEPWTIGRLLTWTTDYLKQHGSSSARLEAELLLASVCQCERIELYTRFGEETTETVRQQFRALVRERAAGHPVAYLLGRREFYSLSFRVTPAVLIPRPETEFAVVAVLDRLKTWLPAADSVAVCDVGTGSGCIAITIARHAPRAQLTAIDVSPAALAVAEENATTHGVRDRVAFLESNLLAAIPSEQKFAVIVSNPPYVSEAEFATLAADVRNYEPQLALVGGATGVEVIAQLVPQAAAHLEPGGWLVLEISPMLVAAVEQLLKHDGRWETPLVTKDLAGHPRIVQVQRMREEAGNR